MFARWVLILILLGQGYASAQSLSLDLTPGEQAVGVAHQPRIKLTPQEQAYLTHKGTLRLCVDPDWMPYEHINVRGQHEGMGADYLALFAHALHIKLELFVTQTWQETLQAAQARQCDLISLAATTEDRKAFLDFTTPYLTFPYVIATTHDKLFIEDIAQELERPYAVVKGYVVGGALRARYPTIKLQEVRNIGEGLEQVRTGKVAGYIDASAAIGYAIQRDAMPDMKIAGKIPIDFQLSVATRNDEPLLHDIFQKVVTQLSDKERQQIFNQWIAVKFDQGTNYSLIWKILAITGTLLILAVYWNLTVEAARDRAQLALAQLNVAQERLKEKNQELERLAVTDQLTGLYNRAQLDAVLAQETQRALRCAAAFGVILLDIDHFKRVNDTHGHQVGDQVLIGIAQLIQKQVRATDTVGRWGGEEFMVICPGADGNGILKLAETMRATIAAHDFPKVRYKTASFGVTLYQVADSPITLVRRADDALYHAKHAGRNQVIMI